MQRNPNQNVHNLTLDEEDDATTGGDFEREEEYDDKRHQSVLRKQYCIS
jgi:hypothetical protein